MSAVLRVIVGAAGGLSVVGVLFDAAGGRRVVTVVDLAVRRRVGRGW